ncbi:MAG: hypothetical protein LBC31_04735 [Treponema sp.]|jgi:hypothetical protein|nr:hypothetical protein [Treponema sp.]
MFFKNTQKAGVFPVIPREPRYTCIARMSINGFDGEAVLRNINRRGFLMESRTFVIIEVGKNYVMRIKPEAASGLNSFGLEVEVRWVRSAETRFNSGFLITGDITDRSFERYIGYIKSRNPLQPA